MRARNVILASLLCILALPGARASGDEPGSAEAAVNAVLDDWHDAAADAEDERYFAHFTPDAVFMGTDATERWSVEAFRAFAHPYFERGRAWSFTPVERHVQVRGDVAWFDEALETPNLGPCRGSGVLVKQGGEGPWKIAHYNLSIPVPNAMADDVVAMIAGGLVPPSWHPLDISVMSFNIRYGLADDGDDAWANRREMVFDVLRSRAPDVVGLQEALGSQLNQVLEALPRYRSVGVGRDDGRLGGEFCAVLYDSDRFRLVEEGTFWLSPTPGEPGSVGYGNALPRVCTWARLADRATGRTFRVVNTHLDHQSGEARRLGAEQIAAFIASLDQDEPVVVTGDFNAGESSPPVRALTGGEPVPAVIDSYRIVHPEATEAGTFNRFTGERSGPKIDYVLVPPEADVLGAEIVRDSRGGRYPSDHFPVWTRVRLP